jgi:RNA polymerase sigma factor (sigma-70 family)
VAHFSCFSCFSWFNLRPRDKSLTPDVPLPPGNEKTLSDLPPLRLHMGEMNMSDTQELLNRYVRDHSESSFESLVGGYVDLVYSVAFRRVGGDTLLAQDVTQLVFTDLARKAAALGNHVMLGGWLHRHTGFVAASLLRGEQRRRTRERQAAEMNALNESSSSDWQEVAPILDEAIDQLDTADRDAVILRYFERCDYRSVGAALGATEDAAQKRVNRALEKLRAFLVKRGATLSATALAAVLGERSVHAAPAGLAAGVSRTALSALRSGAGVGLFAALLKLLTPAGAKLALGAAAVIIIAALWIGGSRSQPGSARPPSQLAQASSPEPAPPAPELSQAAAEPGIPAATPALPNTNLLHLVIVAADSGKPIPNVQIDYRGWESEKFSGKTFTADRFGICDIDIPRAILTRLELTSRSDGFADTRLRWQTDRGDVIPTAYQLRVVRPTPIGGYVLDPDGQPLAGAKVGFNHEDDPATAKWPEDHHFGWIQVATDTNGHWSIDRMAPEMIRSIYGSASHPDFVQSPMVFTSRDKETGEAMRAGTFKFQLGRAVTAQGTVVDSNGQPVAGAKILVGRRGISDSKKGETAADGSFTVTGCRPGNIPVSAEADGFAAATVEADLSADSEPIRLTLQPGKLLILRLLNQNKEPVPKAHVWLDTMRQVPINDPEYGKLAVQANFRGAPDSQGYVFWSNAPDTELVFDIGAGSYMRVNGVRVQPDGQEHVVTLPPALVVSGTVSDAVSREPIPRFRIVAGWPIKNPPGPLLARLRNTADAVTNSAGDAAGAHWSSFSRDRLDFTDGKFRHAFDTPMVGGMANPGYVLKFEAEGYAPFISRAIAPDEGEAQFEVLLQPAKATTVTVLLPDGRPAVQADVGLVMPQAGLELIPGGFSHQTVEGSALLMTDTSGSFQLPPDQTISRVMIAHARGFAETTPAALLANPTIYLEPWGRLEGTFRAGGQPAANRDLLFGIGKADFMSVHTSLDAYRVKTDQAGRFVFNQVPPGKRQVIQLVPNEGDGVKGSVTHQPVADVEIRPGETASVTIGGGYAIKAVLRWPDGLQPTANNRFFAYVQTAYPAALREALKTAMGDPAALVALRQSPELQEYQQNARHFQAAVNGDHTISAEGIPPGDYILSVMVVSRPPAEQKATSSIGSETPFTVPADPPDGTIDLGEILLSEQKLASGH